jgi:hypothetical protein
VHAADNTTLNNPFSLEQPLLSTSEEHHNQHQMNQNRVNEYGDNQDCSEESGDNGESFESDYLA